MRGVIGRRGKIQPGCIWIEGLRHDLSLPLPEQAGKIVLTFSTVSFYIHSSQKQGERTGLASGGRKRGFGAKRIAAMHRLTDTGADFFPPPPRAKVRSSWASRES